MAMTKVEIDIPEEIVPYTVLEDREAQQYDCYIRYHTNYFVDESRAVGTVAEAV